MVLSTPSYRVSRSGWGLRICISGKFPAGVDVARPGTILECGIGAWRVSRLTRQRGRLSLSCPVPLRDSSGLGPKHPETVQTASVSAHEVVRAGRPEMSRLQSPLAGVVVASAAENISPL